ncbi:putative gustatory receptor 89a [Anastrepha ludens]|uniref:putative gustatory receptor 89a n=1 Tax=Anastrepha ludens TaxID=28586 RepID=UPI0023AFB491|nr:putative gustatory receptor 89a [Anastrepha ludens]
MLHSSHQRRRLYTVVYLFSMRLVLLTAQVMLLAPVLRCKQRDIYRTHSAFSCLAILTFLLLCSAAPFLLRIIASTYELVGVQYDNIFVLIAMVSQVSDIGIVLISMISQIWQRQRLCDFLNQLQSTVQRVRTLRGRNLVSGEALLLFWLQLGLTLYDVLTQLVFLANLAFKLDPWQFLVNLASLYLQQCRATLQLLIMGSVLLLTVCYEQLALRMDDISQGIALELIHFEELISLQNGLDELLRQLLHIFQLPLCLVVGGEFINVLANLYAQLYYYVITKALWLAFLFYCAKISTELYLLIHVVHFCCERHKNVICLFLERDIDLEEGMEWRFELTHSDALWPQPIKFYILGLFELDNKFWLFLLAYSVNFIVIILQFGFYT